MNISDRKIEISIVVFSIILIGGLGNLLKTPVQSALGLQDVSYEMPRPKASFFASLFELGERAISRKYINPFKDKEAAKKAAAADAKKKEEAKKNIAQAKKAAQKKKTAQLKKPKVEVDVYGVDPQVAVSDQSPHLGDGGYGAGNALAHQDPRTAEKGPIKEENKDKLSVDQWRALIMAQPTPENVGKMVKAFTLEELSAEGFYSIVAELYRDNRTDVQKLGMMAAKASYNLSAFTVTSQAYESLPPELQTEARNYLMSYGSAARLSVLASALKSSNAVTVELAAEVVMEAHKNSTTGESPGYGIDPRSQRGDIHVSSPNNFAQFVPIFQQLANSTDSQIAGLAAAALSQMQSLVAGL